MAIFVRKLRNLTNLEACNKLGGENRRGIRTRTTHLEIHLTGMRSISTHAIGKAGGRQRIEFRKQRGGVLGLSFLDGVEKGPLAAIAQYESGR